MCRPVGWLCNAGDDDKSGSRLTDCAVVALLVGCAHRLTWLLTWVLSLVPASWAGRF
jgi:hypothetical protein